MKPKYSDEIALIYLVTFSFSLINSLIHEVVNAKYLIYAVITVTITIAKFIYYIKSKKLK